MKKSPFLIVATGGIVSLFLSSYIGGTYEKIGNQTGSAGTTSNCGKSGCHIGGRNTLTNVQVRKKEDGLSSSMVSNYQPGEDYIVTLEGTNPRNELPAFGFQVFATDSNDKLVGVFSNPPLNTKIVSSNMVFESSALLIKNSAIKYVVNVDWKAPEVNVGRIAFHGVIAAVNADGSESGDDVSDPGVYSIDYKKYGTLVKEIYENTMSIIVYPNPVKGVMNIEMSKMETGHYNIRVLNTNGAIVALKNVEINSIKYKHRLDSSAWPSGVYFVAINNDSYKEVITVVKQ